ncbi:hypothetical protein L7F22_015983 [Adiantum nelumboides]|nr:hypothetical protein [Adiantum nelumboides]
MRWLTGRLCWFEEEALDFRGSRYSWHGGWRLLAVDHPRQWLKLESFRQIWQELCMLDVSVTEDACCVDVFESMLLVLLQKEPCWLSQRDLHDIKIAYLNHARKGNMRATSQKFKSKPGDLDGERFACRILPICCMQGRRMRMKNQATKGPSNSDKGTPRKGKSSTQESPIKTGFDRQTYSGGHQFSRQAKEEFLKKRAFGSMGTFGMSNVSSSTFSVSTADVAAISNMKANAAEKLKEKQQSLEAIKIALDQSKKKRDEQVINVFIPYDMKLIVDSFLDHFVSFLHVIAKKDPMEGIFGSLVDGIAHSQVGSSHKPNIDIMCGGCGDKNASQKQASEDTPDQQKAEKRAEKRADVVEAQGDASKESLEVPLKPKPAMNKDVEDAEKSSEKPIEKDTIVNLSDEDADLLITDVCGEILGRRKKRSNTQERTTPNKKAKVASKPPEPTPGVSPAKWTIVAIEVQEINEMEINSLEELSWIGDVQEPDETVEDIAAKQDVD